MPLQGLQYNVLNVLYILAQELFTGYSQELLLRHDLHLPRTQRHLSPLEGRRRPQPPRCRDWQSCSPLVRSVGPGAAKELLRAPRESCSTGTPTLRSLVFTGPERASLPYLGLIFSPLQPTVPTLASLSSAFLRGETLRVRV